MSRSGNVVVYLRDGRTIDLSGLEPEAAIEHLKRYGVTPEMIERTEHQISLRFDRLPELAE